MEIGLFRLVCANGLVIADSKFAQVKRRHAGVEKEEIFEVIHEASKEFPNVWSKVSEYKSMKLTNGQRFDFASKVVEYQWGADSVISPNSLLNTRRPEDQSDDLFSTYNVLQENIIKGGVHYTNPQRQTLRRTRAIKNATRDIRINQELWTMMELFRSTKRFR